MCGRCVRYAWIGGLREKVRGVYRFSSLVKQNKKAKICFVIHIAGKRFLYIYIYDVINGNFFINGPVTILACAGLVCVCVFACVLSSLG